MKSTSILVLLTLLASITVVHAEGTVPESTVTASQAISDPLVLQTLQIKNVSSELMAWWLDPAHNNDPLKPPVAVKPAFSSLKPGVQTGAFSLPAGVVSVSTSDTSNAIVVLGTKAGIAQLQPSIEFLDKPLRQVTVEAQLVEISPKNLKRLGLIVSSKKSSGMRLGFVRKNALASLVGRNKARIIVAPRVTATDNIPTRMWTTSSHPAVIGYKDEAGKLHELAGEASKTKEGSTLENSYQFTVTASINEGVNVTLTMAPRHVLMLQSATGSQTFELASEPSDQIIFNIADGDTLALINPSPAFITALEAGGKLKSSNAILLLSAHILTPPATAKIETISMVR